MGASDGGSAGQDGSLAQLHYHPPPGNSLNLEAKLKSGTPVRGSWALTGAVREIAAGVTVASLALPFCIAAGVLAYTPLGSDYIAHGAVAGLFCGVAGGIAGAIFRRSSFIATNPTTPTALVQASSVAALLGSLGDAAATIAALPVLILLVGAWQIFFGLTGLARVIKFTPYPVLAGFVSGIAILVAVQQLPVLFGTSSLRELGSNVLALQMPHLALPVFGLLLAAAIILLGQWAPRLPNLLIGLVVGFAIYHALRWAAPTINLGPTIGAISIRSIWSWPPIDWDTMRTIAADYDAIKIIVLGSLTLALLGTLDTFFALRTAQHLSDIKVSPKRDVIGQGLANCVSAISGGLVVSNSIALLTANCRAGGRGRISTISSSLVLLIGTLLFPSVIFSLPLIVLAAILIVTSVRLFDRWALGLFRDALFAPERSTRNRSRLNLLVVITVLAATVFGEPVIGAAVGFGLSCLIFIAQMSRPVISRRWSGEGIRSKRVRSHHHGEILRLHGGRIAVLQLQGVLFFGNADDLSAELLALQERCEIVIIDMRRVSDVDTSGATMLQHAGARFRAGKKHLILCGVDPAFSDLLRASMAGGGDGKLFPDRDSALEWAEENLIRTHAADHASHELALAETDLVQQMSPAEIDILASHLSLVTYPAGTPLCRGGDAPDRMWIIKRGSVSVRVAGARGERRLASLAPGCSVGEMGFLDRRPRSADVYADDDVEAYVMTAQSYAAILRDHPRIGQAILANIARQLSERLRDTSEELRMADQ